jgi:hypothetical protein
MSDRTTMVDHPDNQQATTVQIQTSISVGHEDLLVRERRQTSPLSREVLPFRKHQHVTNVSAEYI